MLRKTVLVLALANVAVWLWYQGGLSELAGQGQGLLREPERLERQIHPEWVRLGPLENAAPASEVSPVGATQPPVPEVEEPSASAPSFEEDTPTEVSTPPEDPPELVAFAAPAPTPEPGELRCQQVGPFSAAQASALRAALAAWPEDSWRLDSAVTPARWMVLLRVPDTPSMNQRRAELRSRNVDVDLPAAAFRPGLSLGRFSSEEAARQELVNLRRKGVSGLQVVAERPETSSHTLVLPRADRALRQQANALGRSLLAGQAWQACD